MDRILKRLGLAVLTSLVAACASTAEAPGAAYEATLIVNNQRSSFSSLTVHLVPEAGKDRRLGTVGLDRTREFILYRAELGGRYRLLAEPPGGRGFYSPVFTLSDGDVVEWDLDLNRVLLHR